MDAAGDGIISSSYFSSVVGWGYSVLPLPSVLACFIMFPEDQALGSEVDMLSSLFGMTGVQQEKKHRTEYCSTF